MKNNLRKPADLPNKEGFRFIGHFKDGTIKECVVEKIDHLHTVKNFFSLIGWQKITNNGTTN